MQGLTVLHSSSRKVHFFFSWNFSLFVIFDKSRRSERYLYHHEKKSVSHSMCVDFSFSSTLKFIITWFGESLSANTALGSILVVGSHVFMTLFIDFMDFSAHALLHGRKKCVSLKTNFEESIVFKAGWKGNPVSLFSLLLNCGLGSWPLVSANIYFLEPYRRKSGPLAYLALDYFSLVKQKKWYIVIMTWRHSYRSR